MCSCGAAALFGGYAFAHALPIALVLIFPISRGVAALTALQASFLFYLIAVLWCFGARSAAAAWAGVLAPTAMAGLIACALL